MEGPHHSDYIHVLISIPLKYSVANVVGYLKGKSAIYIARNLMNTIRNYSGQISWARGYFATTVVANEEIVRSYIQNQEKEDKRLEQLGLFK